MAAVAPDGVEEPPELEPQGDPAAKAIEQRSYRLQVFNTSISSPHQTHQERKVILFLNLSPIDMSFYILKMRCFQCRISGAAGDRAYVRDGLGASGHLHHLHA